MEPADKKIAAILGATTYHFKCLRFFARHVQFNEPYEANCRSSIVAGNKMLLKPTYTIIKLPACEITNIGKTRFGRLRIQLL